MSENLDDATRRLNERRYDAVLLNLFLADSRGMSTFAKVHSQVPTLPIVILTGYDNESLEMPPERRSNLNAQSAASLLSARSADSSARPVNQSSETGVLAQ